MTSTIEDIQAMYKCSIDRARQIVRLPGFPSPVPGSGPRSRVWLTSEVRAFMARRTKTAHTELQAA